ncbi:hypothetical protein EXIGLDRAFT_781258 [Exidia glandulosa HHB12029]|uniref:Uncharacterized protein n=1 Tax=Exidia glandulosa HHB12029 TaxID=1314781 RepID=A0A165BAT5_EXIGL|nr:hypothetical protein EXIGLDRAFT_781258 [Exidia glandulosa HHB12029]
MSCQRPDHPTYSTLPPPQVGYPEEDASRALPPGFYDAASENDPPPPYSPPRPSTTLGNHTAPIISTVPGSLAGLNEQLAHWIDGISYDAFVQGVNEALRSARTTRPRHTIAQTTTGWRVTAAWAAGDYIGDRIELELRESFSSSYCVISTVGSGA